MFVLVSLVLHFSCSPPGEPVVIATDPSVPTDPIDPVAPDIEIYLNDMWIENNQNSDLGNVLINTTKYGAVIIDNDGNKPLELSGSPIVEVDGPDSSSIVIVNDPSVFLNPGDSTFFGFTVAPDNTGTVSAELRIETNDPDESIFVINISATGISAPCPVARTGQTTSYAASDDGDLECGILWPDPRFIDNGDGTMTDLLTGLMWETDPSSSLYTWDYGLTRGSASTLGNHEDWRMANINELMSRVDLESSTSSRRYWTSSAALVSTTLMAWVINFDSGELFRRSITSVGDTYVLICRDTGTGAVSLPKTGVSFTYGTDADGDLQTGEPWPIPRFLDYNNGTVADSLTGLIWAQQTSSASLDWSTALDYAESLDAGGNSNWRLPNLQELRSLISYGSTTNTSRLSSSFGFTIPSGDYWTSSAGYSGATGAWIVKMDTGHTTVESITESNSVWAVRGGD